MVLYHQQIYIIFVGEMDTENKIEDLIFEDLLKRGRGRIFFAQEFYDRYPGSSVRFALSNLN